MGISNLIVNNNENTTVTLYGPSEVLATIDYLPVSINVQGLSEDTQFKVNLDKPNGVKHMSMDSVTVDVKLSNDISNVDIEDVGISWINLNSNYGVTPIDIDSVTVKLKGVTDIVNSITADDINVYVDLKDAVVGTQTVDIIVSGNDPRVEYMSSVLKIQVRIYGKNKLLWKFIFLNDQIKYQY